MESSKPHFRTKVSTSKSTAKDVITKSAKVITTNDIIRDIAAKSAKIATINNAIRDIVVQSATRAITTNDVIKDIAIKSSEIATINDTIRDVIAKSEKITTINNTIGDIVAQSATRAITTNDVIKDIAIKSSEIATINDTIRDLAAKFTNVVTTNDIIKDITEKSIQITTINNTIRDITEKVVTTETIISKLQEYLIKKGYSESMISHKYQHDDTTNYDLIVQDQNKKPVEIYEVSNGEETCKQLQTLHTESNIPAYIVSLNRKKQLSIQPTEQSTIKSFIEFYNSLLQTLKIEEEKDCMYFYRGHNDITYPFKPSVYRETTWIEKEETMFKEAIRQSPNEFPNDMSTFDKLVKMQHYNLPTRLLDITTNPLVALYFACIGEDKYKKNGEVVIFKVKKEDIKYFDSDAVCILSNISKRPIDFCVDTSLPSNQQPQIHQLLHDIQQEKSSIKDIYDLKVLEKVFCVLPKMDNQRIIRQSGAFFLFGINSNKKQLADFVQTPLRIVIDKTAKKNILKELSRIGIENSTLFPEMDNRMNRIKEEVLN